MKRVIFRYTERVEIDAKELKQNEIIAFEWTNCVYILKKIHDFYAWVSLGGVKNGYNGHHPSFEAAIDSVKDSEELYVFETVSELLNWMNVLKNK